MVGKKIFAIIEIFLGLLLVVCIWFNGKENPFGNALGFDIGLKNGLLILGIYYLIRALVQFIAEMAEPTSLGFMKKFLLYLEMATGIVMAISSFCDGRETVIERAMSNDITMYHGMVVLGVFFASKAVLQLAFDQVSEV